MTANHARVFKMVYIVLSTLNFYFEESGSVFYVTVINEKYSSIIFMYMYSFVCTRNDKQLNFLLDYISN